MFPIITMEKQAVFEKEFKNDPILEKLPKLCGYCGRACYQMGKEEGANRMLCMGCPLADFCKE